MGGLLQVGWHLHPDTHGLGYATEAAAAVLAHGFAAGITEIRALTHTDNYPSQAVARRLGMEDPGVIDEWYDSPSRHFIARAEEWAPREGVSPDSRPSRALSRGVPRVGVPAESRAQRAILWGDMAEDGGDAPASVTDENAARCPWGGAQQAMESGDTP